MSPLTWSRAVRERRTYQWQFEGMDLPGETRSFLTLRNVRYGHGGRYTVTVRNAAGSATSAPARLNILQPPLNAGAPDIGFYSGLGPERTRACCRHPGRSEGAYRRRLHRSRWTKPQSHRAPQPRWEPRLEFRPRQRRRQHHSLHGVAGRWEDPDRRQLPQLQRGAPFPPRPRCIPMALWIKRSSGWPTSPSLPSSCNRTAPW